MDLKSYYDDIVNEIISSKFEILKIMEINIPEKISPHIEALNYIIFDWDKKKKDSRDLNFEYIIQPKTSVDFTNVSFDDFFQFISSTKNKENILISTKGIKIIDENIEDEIDDFWLT